MSETQWQDRSGQESSSAHRLGQLVVVGTGIQWAGQTTLAARRAIELAERVLFAVADPWAARWIRQLNATADSLSYPREGVARQDIYRAMVDRILAELASGQRVCAVFYGCPAVLTRPAHEAIRRAREAGHAASMLPGVSFLDCLFADLALDPGEQGIQMFEAGDFLLRARQQDPSSHLVLSQIGLIANPYAFDPGKQDLIRGSLQLLVRRLLRDYAGEHPVVLYEAASLPAERPRVERIALHELAKAEVSGISTLYVAPRRVAELDREMQAALEALRRVAHDTVSSAGDSPATHL
jgi:uncharacterized protein YabN with tetrapyrrole methylase and pyrophosphatase domain